MRRLGPDEWKRLISEYEAGEESQKEFAAKRDLSIHTFQFWLYKLREKKKSYSESAGKFLPVTVVASPASSTRAGRPDFMVELAHRGVLVRFPVGTDVRYIAGLISALG